MQMLAASGHTTVTLQYDKQSNTNKINQIINAENLKNITLIGADKSSAQILIDFIKSLSTKNKVENLETLVDGLLFVDTNNNLKQIEKLQIKTTTDETNKQKNIAPALFINTLNSIFSDTPKKNLKENAAIRFLDTNKNVQLKSKDENEKKRFELMQIFANFLDFIHPR